MKGTVTVGNREIPMVANGATNIYYKQLTKQDLVAWFTKNQKKTEASDGIDMLMPLAFVMAMQAEGKKSFSADEYVDWLAQFEPLELEMALDKVMDIYTSNRISTSTPKKNNAR